MKQIKLEQFRESDVFLEAINTRSAMLISDSKIPTATVFYRIKHMGPHPHSIKAIQLPVVSAKELSSQNAFLLCNGFKIYIWFGKATGEAEKTFCVNFTKLIQVRFERERN